jgi:hypothetical protein
MSILMSEYACNSVVGFADGKHESRWAITGSNVTAAICMLDPVLSCLYMFEQENFRMYDHD